MSSEKKERCKLFSFKGMFFHSLLKETINLILIYLKTNTMDNKKRVGRPSGYRCSDATKAKISESMLNYYSHMTDQQKKVRERCNKIKSDLYKEAIKEYYNNLDKY